MAANGTGTTGGSARGRGIMDLEAQVADKIARRKKKGTQFYVEGGQSPNETRTGPFYKQQKAQARQKDDIKAWKNVGKAGKKPELTSRSSDWVGSANFTTPTRRVSPRTNSMSRRKTY